MTIDELAALSPGGQVRRAKQESSRKDYAAYLERWKETGRHVQSLTTPCCDTTIEVKAPSKRGEQWDSLMNCPECGGMFLMVATHKRAEGRIP